MVLLVKVFLVVVLSCCVLPIRSQGLLNVFDMFNPGDKNEELPFVLNKAIIYLNAIPEGRCKSDLFKLYEGFMNAETWALEMLDSWAKPQSGLMTGNIMHIGNYDECLKINSNNVQGQYCSAIYKASNAGKSNITNVLLNSIGNEIKQIGDLGAIKMSFGVCVPKSCTPEMLQKISNLTTEHFELGIELQFQEFLCDYKGKREFSHAAMFASATFSVVIITVLFATVYDLATLQSKERIPILIALSAYTNSKKILSSQPSDETISCLNGIKFISMFWIILGHKYMILPYVPYININAIKEWLENPLNTTVIAASFAVDTFFVTSGLLVSYTFFKVTSKGVKFNLIRYWLHRLVRLTPSLAALVLFLSTLLEYIGDGPLWDLALKLTQSHCENNWWAVLLYIQNYMYPNNNCASQAWFLAVDTQLYILAPILLIPLTRWPKRTTAVILILILGSTSWSFAISWTKDLDLMYYNGTMDFHSFYISTHFRGSSWLIGFIMGHIIFKVKSKEVSLSKTLNLLLWLISLGTMFAIIFGHFSFLANEHSRIRSTFFNTFSRPAWCAAVCWVIFACNKGYGGVVNKFLSLKIFTICVRITYAIFLLHIVQILYTVGRGRLAKYFSNQEELRVIWADFITTMFIAFIWTLLFELPVISLEKVILGSVKRKNWRSDQEIAVENNIYKPDYE